MLLFFMMFWAVHEWKKDTKRNEERKKKEEPKSFHDIFYSARAMKESTDFLIKKKLKRGRNEKEFKTFVRHGDAQNIGPQAGCHTTSHKVK